MPLKLRNINGNKIINHDNNKWYFLSANHVIANTVSTYTRENRIGHPIWQPSCSDGGCENDIIGRLHKVKPIIPYKRKKKGMSNFLVNKIIHRLTTKYKPYFFPISQPNNNYIDCALAECESDIECEYKLFKLGKLSEDCSEAFPKMYVRKEGRTTGTTQGIIDSVDATIKVDYGNFSALFVDQIVIRKHDKQFAAHGDSGSLVYSTVRNPIGMIFAASKDFAIANKMSRILDWIYH